MLLCLTCAAIVAANAAESTNAPASNPTGNGQGNANKRGNQTIQDRATVIPRSDVSDAADEQARKGRPDKTQPTGEVKDLIKQFQTAREKYLKEQQTLLKQMGDTTQDQRQAIRDQMRESLERWKEQQREFLQEQKERAKDLKKELQQDLGRVVDEAKTEGGRGR